MEETFDQDKLIALVRSAADGVFTTMLGQKLRVLEAYQESKPPMADAGLLSLIGFAGPWIGTGSFYCSTNLACRIADCLLMSHHPTVDDEVLDSVGEMTNMILGNVKTELEELLGPMFLSIPTVIYGRNFIKRSVGKREWLVVPFEMDNERLEIQICLAQNPNSNHRVREYSHLGVLS